MSTKKRRQVYWPIRFGWRLREWSHRGDRGPWRLRIKRHWWQISPDRHNRPRYGWTLHLGPLLVKFGPSLKRGK